MNGRRTFRLGVLGLVVAGALGLLYSRQAVFAAPTEGCSNWSDAAAIERCLARLSLLEDQIALLRNDLSARLSTAEGATTELSRQLDNRLFAIGGVDGGVPWSIVLGGRNRISQVRDTEPGFYAFEFDTPLAATPIVIVSSTSRSPLGAITNANVFSTGADVNGFNIASKIATGLGGNGVRWENEDADFVFLVVGVSM